jgi:hypothetical protein
MVLFINSEPIIILSMTFSDLWKLLRQKKSTTRLSSNDDLETKRLQNEERRLLIDMERAKLEEQKHRSFHKTLKLISGEDDDDFEEEDPDDEDFGLKEAMGYLSPILAGVTGKQAVSNTSLTNHTPVTSAVSDADIRDFIAKQDRKSIEIAKTMPKELLRRKISQHLPLNDTEFEKAHQILMAEF